MTDSNKETHVTWDDFVNTKVVRGKHMSVREFQNEYMLNVDEAYRETDEVRKGLKPVKDEEMLFNVRNVLG